MLDTMCRKHLHTHADDNWVDKLRDAQLKSIGKGKGALFIVLLSHDSDHFTITPWYRNSLMYDLISLGRMQRSSRQLIDSVTILAIFRSTRYPLLLGGQGHCEVRTFA